MRIVCIGGGTGLHTLLSGLKEECPHDELAAVVTMTDSGGSTGRLRDEFGYLPPGDIRQSLVALSDAPHELRQLLQHRFTTEGSLHGHTVGNIMLTALKDITGDEYKAIESMERILKLRGKVYPITLTDCQLVAKLEDGSVVVGETNIDVPKHDGSLRITALGLEPQARIFERTAEALRNAEIIIIGPGDLYTSIMPNLIVGGAREAISEAKRNGARIIFITNTMTKYGETNSFKASDFLATVQGALDGATVDAVIVNTGEITQEQREAYAAENAEPVVNDLDGTTLVITGDLVNKNVFARHNSTKLARAVKAAIYSLHAKF